MRDTFSSPNRTAVDEEIQRLKSIIALKDLYRYKSCLVKYSLQDLKPYREYTLAEFVWGFIRDPLLAKQVECALELDLVDIRDEPPVLIVPEINVKKPLCGVQYSIEERYAEIKNKLEKQNTLIFFQTDATLYEVFFEDALIARDLFHLQYDEETGTAVIFESDLPYVIETISNQEYDIVIVTSTQNGEDVRVNYVTSVLGQQLAGIQ